MGLVNMSSSDWLQIVLSLVGFLFGAIISWIFYRAQQGTDFNNLRTTVIDLGRELAEYRTDHRRQSEQKEAFLRRNEAVLNDVIKVTAELQTSANLGKRLDDKQELISIRSTIDTINVNLERAVKTIIAEVRGQQEELSQKVQEKFEEQSQEAIRILEEALRKELKDAVPVQQRDVLLGKFVELIGQAINGMGQFQRLSIEQQSSSALITVESKVTEAINEVASEVKDLKDKVDSLPSALPALAAPPTPQMQIGKGASEITP